MSKRDYTGDSSKTKAPNRTQALIDMLDVAPDPDGAVRLPGGHTVLVRRVTDGRADRTGPPVTTDPKTEAALERVNKLDRAWFRHRPERAHRVRRLVQDEPIVDDTDPPWTGMTVYVVVKQVVPGFRIRVAFWGTRTPCGCETCVADLWLKFAPDALKAVAIEAATIMLGKAS